ncbi:MAG TPA: YiiX/YebB-like N1pC/P60 family cysteine hydrolase [Chthoniobacter sp.]|nr:YiiX/YebB-like N1pC/P60 family cysteine hydrolase [Chthoniobacter sp.]
MPAFFCSLTQRVPFCILVLAITFLTTGCDGQYTPQEGDIAFQALPHNALNDMIEGSTGSPYTHCGILHQSGTEWTVIEAIGPVKETSITAWQMQGREGHFTIYRLKPKYRDKIPAFIKAAQGYEGLPYDIHYDMDDKAIYCSELVFKAFRKATGEELGHLQKVRELKWQPYEAVIKQIEGGTVPLDRVLITPRSVSEAPQLEKVFEESK